MFAKLLFQREKSWFPDAHSGPGFRRILDRVEKSSEEEEQVEGVRLIAEVLISGERREDELFELFCELEGMKILSDLYVKTETKLGVKIQVIQTLNLLISNLTKPTSLYFLYSRGYISAMAVHEVAEEELMENFVAFLKALVLRLDENTVNFFVDPAVMQVQIFKAGCRFFNEKKNNMIAINARNFILLFLKLMVNNPVPIYTDVQRFFSILAIAIRDAYLEFKVERVFADIRDLLLFVHDLADLPGNFTDLLFEQIAAYFLGPTVLASLAPDHSPSDKSLPESIALLALAQTIVCNFSLKERLSDIVNYHFQNTHAADVVAKLLARPKLVAPGLLTLFWASELQPASGRWASIADLVLPAALQGRASALAAVLGVLRKIGQDQGSLDSERKLAIEISTKYKPSEVVTAVETLGMASEMPRLLDVSSQNVLEELLFNSEIVADVISDVNKPEQQNPLMSPSVAESLAKLILLRRLRVDEISDRFVSKLFSLLWFSLAPSPKERATVPVGQLQRLKCVAAGAIGNCYMLLDAQEILLVTPDDQRVEEAKPLMVRPLRGVRECRIENETTLLILTAEDADPVRLVFEDARRSHIALMHVETRKAELQDDLGLSMVREINSEYGISCNIL